MQAYRECVSAEVLQILTQNTPIIRKDVQHFSNPIYLLNIFGIWAFCYQQECGTLKSS